jgi:hypothetical protein
VDLPVSAEVTEAHADSFVVVDAMAEIAQRSRVLVDAGALQETTVLKRKGMEREEHGVRKRSKLGVSQ